MERLFQIRNRGICFSWKLFRLFPRCRPLCETKDYFAGYAFEWLGLEIAFEELKIDGWRFVTKKEKRTLQEFVNDAVPDPDPDPN